MLDHALPQHTMPRHGPLSLLPRLTAWRHHLPAKLRTHHLAPRWQVVIALVLLAHGLVLVALNQGLLRPARQLEDANVVPAMLLSQADWVAAAPQPSPAQAQPARPAPPTLPTRTAPRPATPPATSPAPRVGQAAIASPAPLATRSADALNPEAALSTHVTSPGAAAAAPTSPQPALATPTAAVDSVAPGATGVATTTTTATANAATGSGRSASPALEQPSSQAAYLNNPKPAYPAASRRLGEQGKVIVEVLIGADGRPQDTRLHTSSGFERLDRTAEDSVRQWRFVPGKRNGVPEAMWLKVPVNFVLD